MLSFHKEDHKGQFVRGRKVGKVVGYLCERRRARKLSKNSKNSGTLQPTVICQFVCTISPDLGNSKSRWLSLRFDNLTAATSDHVLTLQANCILLIQFGCLPLIPPGISCAMKYPHMRLDCTFHRRKPRAVRLTRHIYSRRPDTTRFFPTKACVIEGTAAEVRSELVLQQQTSYFEMSSLLRDHVDSDKHKPRQRFLVSYVSQLYFRFCTFT